MGTDATSVLETASTTDNVLPFRSVTNTREPFGAHATSDPPEAPALATEATTEFEATSITAPMWLPPKRLTKSSEPFGEIFRMSAVPGTGGGGTDPGNEGGEND